MNTHTQGMDDALNDLAARALIRRYVDRQRFDAELALHDAMLTALEEGASQAEVARVMNISRIRVTQIVNDYRALLLEKVT